MMHLFGCISQWRRFSLRALLLGVTIFAFGFGYYRWLTSPSIVARHTVIDVGAVGFNETGICQFELINISRYPIHIEKGGKS